MSYDILPGGYEDYENEVQKVFSIGDLLNAFESTSATCVQFIGTTYTLGHLHSWRGSYDIPAFDYEEDYKSPREVAEEIRAALKEIHYGWKGGEYQYMVDDVPYIAHRGSSGEEHKIVDVKNEGGTLYLCTKIIPY